MKILSIETSCDETALAAINASGNLENPSFEVLGTALYSQVESHKPYGGIYPSLAKREHAKNLVPLLNSLFENISLLKSEVKELDKEVKKELEKIFSREPELLESFLDFIPKMKRPDFNMIAVTTGPGLEPALWVGINFARALSLVWQIPVMAVNHMEGHIVSVLNCLEKSEIDFPAIGLLISGGHTQIVSIKNWSEYKILGNTKDDAAGEAFDKTARVLGLEYPGGPQISKMAEEAREKGLSTEGFELPRPMINTDDLNFSFSGLKTAVLYMVKKLEDENKLDQKTKTKIALEIENAITDVLYKKTTKALKQTNAKTLIIGGGVINDPFIRESFQKLESEGIKVLLPGKGMSTDNAVMIAIAGFLKSFKEKPEINPELKAVGNWRVSD